MIAAVLRKKRPCLVTALATRAEKRIGNGKNLDIIAAALGTFHITLLLFLNSHSARQRSDNPGAAPGAKIRRMSGGRIESASGYRGTAVIPAGDGGEPL